MICIKCGLELEKPQDVCPRCGNVIPKIEIERSEIEAGSLDAWSEDAAVTYVSAKRNMPRLPLISPLIEAHPGAWPYVGALAIRITFYLLNLIIMLFSTWTIWSGIGLFVNLIVASVAMLLIAAQDRDEDWYWLRPISTIITFADGIFTWLVLLAPIVIKIVDIIITPLT